MTDKKKFLDFINQMKKEKGVDETNKYLSGLVKFGAAELYLAFAAFLTDDDLASIEKIADDEEKAKAEAKRLFKERAGLTPEEFITTINELVAQGFFQKPL